MIESDAIRIRDVRKVYGAGEGQVVALDTISLGIRENEFFTLLGPSGCGKTTLLRMIAGFDFPSSGEILLHGNNIAALPPFKRPVNTVFQSYALFPHMSVAENIGFGLKMLGKPRAEVDARVKEMLDLVRMQKLADRRTSQLSGGQQQRVALARALAPYPKVLLLDEPLSALDYKLRKDMQFELKRLQLQTAITFIFVTHDQEEALTMSDRIAVMSAGRVLQVGTPREIYDRPLDRFVAGFIGESNLLRCRVGKGGDDKVLVSLSSGHILAASKAHGFVPDREATIAVRPEHAKVTRGVGHLSGRVEAVIYLGTDTQIQVRLDEGDRFTVRQQSSRSQACGFEPNERVGIVIADDAAQVLVD